MKNYLEIKKKTQKTSLASGLNNLYTFNEKYNQTEDVAFIRKNKQFWVQNKS